MKTLITVVVVAFAYDPEWEPSLINSWNYDLSDSGKFFSQAMQGNLP